MNQNNNPRSNIVKKALTKAADINSGAAKTMDEMHADEVAGIKIAAQNITGSEDAIIHKVVGLAGGPMDHEDMDFLANLQKRRQGIVDENKAILEEFRSTESGGCNSDEITKKDADSFVKAMSKDPNRITNVETPDVPRVEKISRRGKGFDDNELSTGNSGGSTSSRGRSEEDGYMSGVAAASQDELEEYEARVAEQEALVATYDL